MLETYSGATRVIFIAGDPIAQVKSPAGVTRLLRERGGDQVVVPAHVKPGDLAALLSLAGRMPNVDGVIATVPHKFDLAALCTELTPRARSIGAANVARRLRASSNAKKRVGGDPSADPVAAGWFGDMSDGEAYVAGLLKLGFDVRGKRALVVGAGGAGSAIAHSLVDAGVSALAVHDTDPARRDALLEKIARYAAAAQATGGGVPVPSRDDAAAQAAARANTLKPAAGSADPRGYDLVINATPIGMRPSDPLPVDADRLGADIFVGDVITAPVVTPLLAAARAKGCRTMTGVDMFDAVGERIALFYSEPPWTSP